MRPAIAVIALLALVACEPPQARIASHHQQYAVEIVFHDDLPGLSDAERAELHATYEAAIRADLTAAVGESTSAPIEDGPLVKVEIKALQLAAYPPKGGLLTGWFLDSTVNGVLDHLTRDPQANAHENGLNNSYLDRYIDRKVEAHRLDRLGYLPLLVRGKLSYADGSRTYVSDLNGEDMLTTFQPLASLGDRSPRAIRAEEARVLGKVVAERLGSTSGWTVRINR